MVIQLLVQPLEAKLDMELMGEAMFIVMMIVLSFLAILVWAQWRKRKRSRK
jgi:cbb3-type cytochrome oxidase subunit 3